MRGARSKLVGMCPPPINLLFHDFLTSPFRRFLGRVDVLNNFEPALSVCCPPWAYLVLFYDYGVKVIVAKIIIINIPDPLLCSYIATPKFILPNAFLPDTSCV